MKSIRNFESVYFIGIGGIGMSALAQYFLHAGKQVAGYDRTPTDITQMLQDKNIDIHFEDDLAFIGENFKNPATTLVIYTPAVKEHSELKFFQENGFQVVKRSQVLGMITESSFCFAVAGTHGKTTTSSILAHILSEVNAPMSAFLGGIAENFGSNLVLKGSEMSVVEADEFDRSFLQLSPNIACITSVDADHLDIYGTEEEFRKGFQDFVKKIKNGGKLLVRNGLPFEGITFGLDTDKTSSDYTIKNIQVANGRYIFDVEYPNLEADTGQFVSENVKKTEKSCVFSCAGRHNLLNALTAVAMAHQGGFPMDKLLKALASFKGVRRRFSYQILTEEKVFIDDYAHHPSELEALHQAVREMHPNKRATIIFQPHLFTRTRDFIDGFVTSLSKFDQIILLDIYPARELPIEGVTSQWLLEKIPNTNKMLLPKEELLSWVKKNDFELLITSGAGDIFAEVSAIKRILE